MARREGRVIGIVDDDSSLRRSLRNLLMSVGYRVETFESAEAFLQSGDRDEIGCVVLDVRLGEIEPMAYRFLLNFAQDNELKVRDGRVEERTKLAQLARVGDTA